MASSSSAKADPDHQGLPTASSSSAEEESPEKTQRPTLSKESAASSQPGVVITTESLPDLVLSRFSQEDILRYSLRVQQHYKTPVVFLALMADNGMYLKGRVGVDTRFVPLPSICHPGPSRGLPIIIMDTWKIGFHIKDPLVERPPYAKFFAAAPVVMPRDRCIGTLCIVDSQPKQHFTLADCDLLVDIASQISVLLTTHLGSLLSGTVESLESLPPHSQERTSQASSSDRGKTLDSLPSMPSLSHEGQSRTFDSLPGQSRTSDSLPIRSHDSLPGMHTTLTCDNLQQIPEAPECVSPRSVASDLDGGTQQDT